MENNPVWLNAVIVLFTQVMFLYLRTLNIKFTADRSMLGATLTSLGVGVCWLLAIYLGVMSLGDITNQWPVTVSHLVGGTLGTFLGMLRKEKKL